MIIQAVVDEQIDFKVFFSLMDHTRIGLGLWIKFRLSE
jgi:hypothetical protein